MSRTYTCDMCGDRIAKGVTVATTPRLTDNTVSLAADDNAVTNHVCLGCWPEEQDGKGLLTRIMEMVK